MFDLAQDYDALLQQGIRLSGENKAFFIQGRIRDLGGQLPPEVQPRRILDFGCGIGDTAPFLADRFPQATVTGFDTCAPALAYARQHHEKNRVSFCDWDALMHSAPFDLCYCNGVFHHIPPDQRAEAIAQIYRVLEPGGHFALFENNPFNPGTHIVMRRIPFDRDAQTLTPGNTRRLLQAGGFAIPTPPRFLFYFPRCLAVLRRFEPPLARLPLGAQYYFLARK